MKLTKTIGSLAAFLLLCIGATSCNNDKNEEEFKVQQQITDSFLHIVDISGAHPDMNYTGVSYSIIYDYVAATADVTIKGLKLPDNSQYPALTLKNIPFKVTNEGARLVEGSNLVSTSEGFPSTPVFDHFKLTVGDRVVSEVYYPMLSLEYTVNGVYKAVGSITSQLFSGSTVTTDATGASFTNEEPVYALVLDIASMKASLTINNAKFVQAMPAQTMTFAGIPFTISETGIIAMESTQTIIPTINKVPFEAFPITGFKATYTLTKGMDVEFVCTIDNPAMADKIKGSPFRVTAQLPFAPKNDNK